MSRERSVRPRKMLVAVANTLGVVFGLVSLGLSLKSLASPSVYRIDFLQDYVMGRAIVDGGNPYLPTRDLAERYVGVQMGAHFPHPTPHPPPAGLLFILFTPFSYASAATVWFGLEVIFLVASVYLVTRTEGVRLSPGAVFAISVTMAAWYPVSEDLGSGQLMLLLLLLLVGARLALKANRPGLGGALVGLAVLAKPVPWPVVLLFAIRKEWRALGSSLATIAVGYALSVVAIGPNRLVFYFTQVLPTVTTGYRAVARNFSLWTVGWRVFDGTQQTVFGGTVLPAIAAPPLTHSSVAASVVSAGLPVLVLLLAAMVVRRQPSTDLGLGLMLCVSILISPTAWSNYLVLAAIPIVQIVGSLVARGLPRQETALALIVAGTLVVPLFVWAMLAFAIAGQVPPSNLTGTMPFAPALLTLFPLLSVGALGLLEVVTQPGEIRDDSVRCY